jgi:hypothetical protein
MKSSLGENDASILDRVYRRDTTTAPVGAN